MFEQQPILVGKISHPGGSHGCCPVHIEDSEKKTRLESSHHHGLTKELGEQVAISTALPGAAVAVERLPVPHTIGH